MSLLLISFHRLVASLGQRHVFWGAKYSAHCSWCNVTLTRFAIDAILDVLQVVVLCRIASTSRCYPSNRYHVLFYRGVDGIVAV